MATVTISVRLSRADAARLEQASRDIGIERATFLKWALKRGAEGLMLDRACDAYRRGQATLSRAAEMAGLSLRDMILRLRDQDLELSYGVDDLELDLQRS